MNNKNNFNFRSTFSTNEANYLTIQKALLSNNQVKVLNIIKKSPRLSTEGLFFDNGIIYESGFYKNKSFLLKKEFKSNKLIKTIPLLSLSGKGIAKCGDNFYQLTEKEKKVLKYSYPNLDLISTSDLDNEMIKGEGLTSLSKDTLVATDGSNNIYILSCQYDLNVIQSIPINDELGNPINGLLDITVVGNYLYANREGEYKIFKINPRSGLVVRTYDLMNLINYEIKMKSINKNDIASGSILNGITYDEERKIFILTGRNWAFYYEVKLD
jgi:glutamine cyclotransferase